MKVYHGDNFGLTHINGNYKRIADRKGNMALGVGIYFAEDIKTAKLYGNKIVSTIVDKEKLLPSLSYVSDFLKEETIAKLLNYYAENSEDFWYMYSDYNIEVTEREDYKQFHSVELASYLMENQTRNLMKELWQRVHDTKVFVDGWVNIIKKYGTYDNGIYALVYNEEPLKKVEGFNEFINFSEWKNKYIK